MSEKDTPFDRLKIDKNRGRDIDFGPGGVKRAARASQNLPQAVVKVSSFSHGQGRAGAHLSYISRNGDLSVEDPQGNKLQDAEELKERMEEWASDFDSRKRSRDTVNIVLSAPKDSELGAVERSVRAFAQKEFGQSNDYLFAIHNDTDHPHGHLMVKMRGYDGEKLNPGKTDLKRWRESFAESLREQGIQVDATTRAERGQGKKGQRQALYHLRKRETPNVDREAVRQLIVDARAGVDQAAKPWALAAKARTEEVRQGYAQMADSIGREARAQGNKGMAAIAESIRRHSRSIPTPKTRAEEYQQQFKASKGVGRDGDIER
ncbi:relaxase/mobilization nuclease domain-containing protein [Gilvimarinus chinensis]|uniref:relaxase/mobilization nuclease domain-containing protein n=1 Tax=Gilvimarinus chinensis TaxID=396005 RepID=UPI000381CB5C|nr:relaxase/mobilization nuclease domain-containing protein [Gilvimarinus chinensis]